MKKVIVIGCSGGGKSVFSRALAEQTGLPLHHLDMLYWNADKTTVPKSVFLERLDCVLQNEEWIIDGNYASTMEKRMALCDTVFFLDYSTDVCLSGLSERKGKPRSDMPWIEDENGYDEEFVSFVKNYYKESRPKVLQLLEKYKDKNIVVFHNREESEVYLREKSHQV